MRFGANALARLEMISLHGVQVPISFQHSEEFLT